MRLVEITSPLQTIELWEELGAGLVLVLDGMVQFRETEEHRYHECLTVVPCLYGRPRRVFIGGGGDGLAATRLLKLEGVESVVVCDYDPAITELSRRHPDLAALNEESLDDPRVRLVNADAYAYLRDTDEVFDLVICDFPDPFYLELGRLYSRQFYELVRERLTPEGLLVTQTLAVPQCAAMVGATLATVWPHCRFYKFGPHGFTLASSVPLERIRSVPAWARFLSDEYVECLFVLSREETAAFSTAGAAVIEEGDSALVREAILHVHGKEMAYPCEDQRDTWVVEIGTPTADKLGDRTALLLEALHDNGRLVVLLERGRVTEQSALQRLGYRSTGRVFASAVAPVTGTAARRASAIWSQESGGVIVRLDALTDALGHHPDLMALVEAAERPVLLAEAGVELDLDRRTVFLVARADGGEPLAVWRLGNALDGVRVDWLGGAEDHLRDSFLLVFLYLAELQYAGVTLRAPAPELITLLTRLGTCRVQELEVYLGEA